MTKRIEGDSNAQAQSARFSDDGGGRAGRGAAARGVRDIGAGGKRRYKCGDAAKERSL